MPARATVRRGVVALAAVGVGASVLSACSKPLPDVTFASGSRSVVVTPSQYCWTLQRDTCHGSTDSVHTLLASPGSTILISVPRVVSTNAWVATAYTVNDSGQRTPIEGAGSSLLVDQHNGRVFVPLTTGTYQLAVSELRGDTQTAEWTLRVQIGST